MHALQKVLGAERGLEGVFNQRDVGICLRELNASELLGHRKEVDWDLSRVHQQHRPAGGRQVASALTSKHAHCITWQSM